MKKALLIIIGLSFLNFLIGQTTYPDFEILQGLDYDITTGSLSKSIKSGWDEGYAYSSNLLESGGQGIIEYSVDGLADTKAFGIAPSGQSAKTITQLSYAFYISKGSLYITEGGKVKAKLGKVKAGVQLNIEISASKLVFLMNGKVVSKVTIVPEDFVVGAVIYNQGGELVGISPSFPPPPPPPPSLSVSQYTLLTKLPSSFVKEVDEEFCFSFKYSKAGSDDIISYAIYNKYHFDRSIDVQISNLGLRHGMNQFCMSVNSIPPGIYTLEVELPNGDMLYSKFFNSGGTYDEVDSDIIQIALPD